MMAWVTWFSIAITLGAYALSASWPGGTPRHSPRRFFGTVLTILILAPSGVRLPTTNWRSRR